MEVLVVTFNSCKKITGTTQYHLSAPTVIGKKIIVELAIVELSSEIQ